MLGMRLFLILILAGTLTCADLAFAGSSDAREVARLNNCNPKKIEVFSQSLGPDSPTIYRVECNMPKTTKEASPQAADAVLIQCNGALCDMLRPVSKESK